MQKRQTHSKSRRGCKSCKQRHVKCDEQTPSCAGCVVRKTACVYPGNLGSKTNNTNEYTFLTRRPKKNAPKPASEHEVSSPPPVVNSNLSMIAPLTPSLSSSVVSFSSTSEGHRLLELELMHRWSTKTWAGICCIPEQQEHIQISLPQSALGNSYLLNGILAAAAVDLALSHGENSPSKYFHAALEYSTKGSADFRTQISNVTPDNINSLYYFAMMAAMFQFAIPSGGISVLDRLNIAFDMLLGSSNIALSNIKWFSQNYCDFEAVLNYGIASLDILDLDTKIALDRITSVSQQLGKCPVVETGDTEKKALTSEEYMYLITIAQLKNCFAEDVRGFIKGYCLTLITVAGSGFALASKNSEPLALFIIMHLGVLLDRMARSPTVWWMSDAGRELVREISEILERLPVGEIQDVKEGIWWTRQQVGLPSLVREIEWFIPS